MEPGSEKAESCHGETAWRSHPKAGCCYPGKYGIPEHIAGSLLVLPGDGPGSQLLSFTALEQR